MDEERVVLLIAQNYDQASADGPAFQDGKILSLGPPGEGPDAPVLDPKSTCTLRVVARNNADQSVIAWMTHHAAFWANIIPQSDLVAVRTFGWPELWDSGYPQTPCPIFRRMLSSELKAAVLASPLSSPWWLEVADIPDLLVDPTVDRRYFAFHDHGWGADPLLIGGEAWIADCVELISGEYGKSRCETRELVPGALEKAISELEAL